MGCETNNSEHSAAVSIQSPISAINGPLNWRISEGQSPPSLRDIQVGSTEPCEGVVVHNYCGDPDYTVVVDCEGQVWIWSAKRRVTQRIHGM